MLTFLHLSDLHISAIDADTQFDRGIKIREALAADLGPERTNFDAILVTGDLAYNGLADEFVRAKAWLEEIRAKTNSSPDALFVVPGNHDVDRKTVAPDSSLWDLHQSLRTAMTNENRLASLNKKLQDPFDFLAALNPYRMFAAEYDCASNPRDLAWVQVLGNDHLLEDGTPVRFHGLNSALLSDGEDKKANLLLGATQFHHFSSDPGYINVVLCHHPHPWLMDGNEANDFFRTQAQLVLCGHEHDVRCYKEGDSVRLFAGAVHPNPRESHWEPCYHVITLSINSAEKRVLNVGVETRVWRDKDKCFGPYVQKDGSPRYQETLQLPAWRSNMATKASSSPTVDPGLSSAIPDTVSTTPDSDSFAAARRKLIVHFFRLGTLSRYQVVISAGVWDDTDDTLDGQARWARVFERAEKAGKFDVLWEAVASKDELLSRERNPFSP
jgi:3',5'-cyclic AMP phosphodiesterase CpdA